MTQKNSITDAKWYKELLFLFIYVSYKRTYGSRNLKYELAPNRVSQNTFFDTLNTMVQQKNWFGIAKPGSWEVRFLEIGPCLSQDIPNQKRQHNTNRSTSVEHQLYDIVYISTQYFWKMFFGHHTCTTPVLHLNHTFTTPKSHSTTTLSKQYGHL